MAIAAFLPLIGKVIDLVLPDPNKAAEMKLKAAEMAQKGELAQLDADVRLAIGQLEINKAEAASASVFKGGWRPAVGWVCAISFGYSYVVLPFLMFLVFTFGSPEVIAQLANLPRLEMGEMMPVLFGMLGLGAMRTREKEKGVAAK